MGRKVFDPIEVNEKAEPAFRPRRIARIDLTSRDGGFGTYGRVSMRGFGKSLGIKVYKDRALGIRQAESEYRILERLAGAKGHAPLAYAYGRFTDVDGVEQGALVMQDMGSLSLYDALSLGILTGGAPGPLSAEKTLEIALAIARALAACGELGVAHRDLWPENVLIEVSPSLEVRKVALIDFGQSEDALRMSVTTLGQKARLAQMNFGAPEMFGGDHYDLRNKPSVDLWSLGAIVYWARTGRVPHAELSGLRLSSPDDSVKVAEFKRDCSLSADLRDALGGSLEGDDGLIGGLIASLTSFAPKRRGTAADVVGQIEHRLSPVTPAMTTPVMPAPAGSASKSRSRAAAPRKGDTLEAEFEIDENGVLIKYHGDERLLTIPASVRKIGKEAFSDCAFLESVDIRYGVTEIGERAFSKCAQLKSVAVPDSVKKIGESAFYKCSSLEGINLPRYLKVIERSTFEYCTSLRDVRLRAVEEIGACAFSKCRSLEEISMPGSVRAIGFEAFLHCKSLNAVFLKNGDLEVDSCAFCRCSSLERVVFEEDVAFRSELVEAFWRAKLETGRPNGPQVDGGVTAGAKVRAKGFCWEYLLRPIIYPVVGATVILEPLGTLAALILFVGYLPLIILVTIAYDDALLGLPPGFLYFLYESTWGAGGVPFL